MMFLTKKDFTFTNNLTNVMSEFARYTIPRNFKMNLDNMHPYMMRITAHEAANSVNTTTDFSFTPTYKIADSGNYSRMALAYGASSEEFSLASAFSSGSFTFPAFGTGASETIHVWYLLGEGRYRIARHDIRANISKLLITEGSIKSINLRNQYSRNDLLRFEERVGFSEKSRLIIEAETDATIQMVTNEIVEPDINDVGLISIPVEYYPGT